MKKTIELKARTSSKSRKSPENLPTLTQSCAKARDVSEHYSIWRAAVGQIEVLCSIVDPYNDRSALVREAYREAYGAEDTALWGMIKARAAYPVEVAQKLEVYRHLVHMDDDMDNRVELLLESAITDLIGGSMDTERKDHDMRDKAEHEARKAEAAKKGGAK